MDKPVVLDSPVMRIHRVSVRQSVGFAVAVLVVVGIALMVLFMLRQGGGSVHFAAAGGSTWIDD